MSFQVAPEKPSLKQSDSYPAPRIATETHALAYIAQAETTQQRTTGQTREAGDMIDIVKREGRNLCCPRGSTGTGGHAWL